MFGNVVPVLSAGNIAPNRPELVIVAANNFVLPNFPSSYTFGAVILMSNVSQGEHTMNIWLEKGDSELTKTKVLLVDNQKFHSNNQANEPGKSGVITVNFMNKTIPSEGKYILKTKIDDYSFNDCEIHFSKKSEPNEQ